MFQGGGGATWLPFSWKFHIDDMIHFPGITK